MKHALTTFCFLVISTSLAYGSEYDETHKPSDNQVELLQGITKSCPDGFPIEVENEQIGNLNPSTDFSAQVPAIAAYKFSQKAWDAIVAAGKKIKELNWVVLDNVHSGGAKVVTMKEFESGKYSTKDVCEHGADYDSECGETAAEFGQVITGQKTSTGKSVGDKQPTNCLRPEYGAMIHTLLHNGYVYDNAKKYWRKTDGTPDSSTILTSK